MKRCEYSTCPFYGKMSATDCSFCSGEEMPGRLNPEYYAGTDFLKSGDQLITAERDRQVDELGFTIARDLRVNSTNELEQMAILLLNPVQATYGSEWPINWNRAYVEKLLCKPVQVRRVIAGALICAQIDVDNLKYQVLINEQKTSL